MLFDKKYLIFNPEVNGLFSSKCLGANAIWTRTTVCHCMTWSVVSELPSQRPGHSHWCTRQPGHWTMSCSVEVGSGRWRIWSSFMSQRMVLCIRRRLGKRVRERKISYIWQLDILYFNHILFKRLKNALYWLETARIYVSYFWHI